jgi:hypothetical protein
MRHFDTKSGLPSNEVYQLLSDSKGYIWICTDAGLVKYNGNTFKNFTSANGMPDNTIFQVKEDKFGRIWYVSYTGKIGYVSNDTVHVIDLGEEIEKYVTNGLITSIAFDRENALYIGRRNLEKISFLKVIPPYRKKDISTVWNENKTGVSVHIIDQKDFVFCDSRSNVFINEHDISIYDNSKLISSKTETFSSNVLFTRAYMKENSLYLVFGKDLIKFDTRTGETKRRSSENDLVTVTSIEPGVLIIGESLRGLRYVNENLESIDRVRELEDQTITYAVKDYQGGTWISTHETGVYYVPEYPLSFLTTSELGSEKIVRSLKLNDSTLLIGLYSGELLQLQFKNNGSPELSVLFDNKSKVLSRLNSVFPDNTGKVIVSGTNGSFHFDKNTKKLSAISKDYRISSTASIRLHEDIQLYLGLSGITQIEEREGKQLRKFYKSEDRLSSLAYIEKTNTILVGGLRGLYKFNFEQVINTAKPILSCRTEDIKPDQSGTVYVATRAYGLIILREGRKNDTISVKNGLISNICKSVTIDSNFVWVCTNRGVSRIKFNSESDFSIYNYRIEDFLGPASVSNLFILNNKAVFYSGRSLYWFAKKNQSSESRSGIIAVTVGTNCYNAHKPFTLPHDPADIKIHFEALLYDLGGDLNYRYRVTENEPWTRTKENTLTLAKLSSGEYKIEIQAINKQSEWFALSDPVRITIEKAFYQKVWFIILVLIMISLTIFLIIKRRYNRIFQEEKMKNELKINMLELETKVVKAQMNPHFIFNSLNSIQQFILADENENAYLYLTKFSKLVRKLLESTTRENISLENEIDLLNRYIEIESLRFEDSFSYKLYVGPELNPASVHVPHMIIQPFVENAIWHGLLHKKGERMLKISFLYLNNNCITCIVEDNGVGRVAKNMNIADKSSLAMEFIKRRLDMINEVKNSGCGYTVIDKTEKEYQETGTIVDIKIPIMN